MDLSLFFQMFLLLYNHVGFCCPQIVEAEVVEQGKESFI